MTAEPREAGAMTSHDTSSIDDRLIATRASAILACSMDENSNPEACFYDPADAMYGPDFCHAHGEVHGKRDEDDTARTLVEQTTITNTTERDTMHTIKGAPAREFHNDALFVEILGRKQEAEVAMTETERELIAEARLWPRDGVNEGSLLNALADALEARVTESVWEYGTALRTPSGEVWDHQPNGDLEAAVEHHRTCVSDPRDIAPDTCVLVRRVASRKPGEWELFDLPTGGNDE